jgi:hypothetical protein
MRAHKLREEAAEKERHEHFNTIQHMIPVKQEWREKEKISVPTLTTSDDDIDLLDDDESPLINAGLHHRLAWMSTWSLRYQPSSGVLRMR